MTKMWFSHPNRSPAGVALRPCLEVFSRYNRLPCFHQSLLILVSTFGLLHVGTQKERRGCSTRWSFSVHPQDVNFDISWCYSPLIRLISFVAHVYLQLALFWKRKTGHHFSPSFIMILGTRYLSICKEHSTLHLHHYQVHFRFSDFYLKNTILVFTFALCWTLNNLKRFSTKGVIFLD